MAVSESREELWSDEKQRVHLRRNYVAMALDGGLYFGGVALVAPESVLPAILKELGGPTWLVALAPTLAMAGYFLGPMFTAHVVERRAMFRNYVALVSVPQRLPPLIAGVLLILWSPQYPSLALWAVALSPLLVSLLGGASATGFWEIFAKVLPVNRRSSNMAVRNVLGTAFGVLAGAAIAWILSEWPGVKGYGILHVACFAAFVLSLTALLSIKELPHVPRPGSEHSGWTATFAALPKYWRIDKTLRGFVVARVFGFGVGIVTPFLAVRALAVLERPAAFLGTLVMAQSVGAIAGNLVAGWLGDRFGGRIVGTIGGVSGAVMCFAAMLSQSSIGFLVVFFLLGASKFLWNTGSLTLMLELFPGNRRPTYVAIISILTLPAMLLSAFAAGVLWSTFGTLWPAALVGGLVSMASLMFLLRLPEPRRGIA